MSRPTYARRIVRIALAAAIVVACAAKPPPTEAGAGRCPPGMTYVEVSAPIHAFCIDQYEASLVEITPAGERPYSPYLPVGGHKVRAVSRAGVVPQAYISRNEAAAACVASMKRLCTEAEWVNACEGPAKTKFPYGAERETGWCNDNGKPALPRLHDYRGGEWQAMNDPRLNQLPSTVSPTGSHPRCKSSWGAFDMMGNVHEWVADPGGTFLGGYYLDTVLNGDGCHYKTVAHDAAYHDYSTGFRCCASAR